MKKSIIKIIATVLSAMMLTAYIPTSISADHATDFEFDLNDDGASYTVTGYYNEIEVDDNDYGADDENLDVVIPAYHNGKPVTIIGDSAFMNKDKITSVSIPLTVKVIEPYAFYDCSNLRNVSVSRVETIDIFAFSYCTSLEKVVIPETVTLLGRYSYSDSHINEGVNFAGSTDDIVIEENVFIGCSDMVIYGYEDSLAEEYADLYDIRFNNLEPEETYTDINPNHWWYNAVKFVTAYDLCSGKEENGELKFKPADNITRAEAMTILWGFEGKPCGYTTTFTDVNLGNWCYDQIAWAQTVGISSGVTATTFGTNNNVTKVQLITFLYNYASYRGYDMNTDGYTVPSTVTDFNNVPNYAKEAVTWAAKNNIITTTGVFSPNSNATRAIAATTIYAFMHNVD